MFLSKLSLTHFRNYRSLVLDFEQPITLLQGQNAQGKSNLLEAIYLLATSKPVHAQSDQEVVGWSVEEAPLPYCRVAATVSPSAPALSAPGEEGRREKSLELEILYTPRVRGSGFQKQIKINGVNRRALDLVGQMRAVLFLPEDIKLVAGSPSERRRYLDVALCQIDRQYTKNLSRFQKVLTQRNSLLRSMREQGTTWSTGSADGQLRFWDEQLVASGSAVIERRCRFVADLLPAARQHHARLSHEQEALTLVYIPSFNPGYLPEETFVRLKESPVREVDHQPAGTETWRSSVAALQHAEIATIEQAYATKLSSRRTREIAAGMTLYGPHRDDLAFGANDRDLRTYGSRGQQRTAALALKLAEIQTMSQSTGSPPVLLLDDVMSELDARRRHMLLDTLTGIQQAIVTTTDWEDFEHHFLARAARWSVNGGVLERG